MSTNERLSPDSAGKAPHEAPAETPAGAPEEDFYEEEFTPGEADGGMFGAVPAKKAQHFWPSAKRLMGLLKPERAGIEIGRAHV